MGKKELVASVLLILCEVAVIEMHVLHKVSLKGFAVIEIISHYKKIGYNINVLQQTACLVVNPITVGNFPYLFNCTPVGRTSDSMTVPT